MVIFHSYLSLPEGKPNRKRPIEWCSAHLWQVIGDGFWLNFTTHEFGRYINPKHRKESCNSRVSTLLLVIAFNVGQIPVTRCFLAKYIIPMNSQFPIEQFPGFSKFSFHLMAGSKKSLCHSIVSPGLQST